MKRLILIGLIAAFLGTGCLTRIEPGYAGIVVNLAGDDRGVADYTIETGWVFYNPFTQQVFEYATFVHTHRWERASSQGITFNSGDGLQMMADVSMAYAIQAEAVPQFYVTFRHDDLDLFTNGFMRNEARSAFQEAATQFTADEIYGPRKGELITAARQHLITNLEPYGVEITQFDFIGAPVPPDSVVQAINRRVEATQEAERAVNEKALAEAEAAKAVATAQGELDVARLRAQQNVVLARSIDDNMLRWKQQELTEMWINKWSGHLPNVVTDEGSGMLMQVNPKQNSGR